MIQKIKDLFKAVQSKHGSYSVGIIAVVVAIVIVLNLLVAQLPDGVKQIDISSNNLYDISSTSTKLIDKLNSKVKITVLANRDDTDKRIRKFITKYAGLSKKISVEWIDPVLHPSALTENNAEENTVIVSCADTKRTTSFTFDDIITYDESSYYTTGSATESTFDGEGQLTGALNYVTSTTQENLYYTSGHGESTFSTTISDLLEKSNIAENELNLVMNNSIPDNCGLLILCGPTKDITEAEKKTIETYMTKGGKVMILLGDTDDQMTNLSALLKEYGMQMVDGYMADTERCYQQNPYYIFPNITADSTLASNLTSKMVLIINSKGFSETTPARDTITTSSFLETSSNGYAIVSEDKQTQGTYWLGAVATEDQSRLTVFGNVSIIDSQIAELSSTLENTTLFMNAVTSNFSDAKNASVPAKKLQVEMNTVQRGGLFSAICILGIPLIILVIGFVIWIKRRRA